MRNPQKSPFASKFVLISMGSLFFIALLSLLLFFSLSSATHHHLRPSPPQFTKPIDSIPPEIHQACAATRYPETCETSLIQSTHVPANPNPTQIIQSAIWISSENLKTAQSMVQTILDSSGGNLNRSIAAKNCLEVLHNSEHRIQSTVDILPRGKIKDGRAWMSAALLFQYDCWSALKYVNDTQKVNETMAFLDSLIGLTSNALSMLMSYDIFGNETGSWRPPLTERNGFWEHSGDRSELDFKGGLPSGLTVDVTVCKGKCDHRAVQEAVDAAPDNFVGKRFVIGIKEGVYEETVRVPFEKKNLVFWGDGIGRTVITGSLSAGQHGISTYNTATVGVLGDGFMANGLTIKNTAGPDAHQAVAFRSDSDKSFIQNCEFIGNQDTLYAHSLRQFYKSCQIQGNVDFIFGNSASIFQDCLVLIRPRQLKPEKGESNAVTAHGRTDPAQSTGFVFQNCVVNGTDDYMALYYENPKVHRNFLGRPWKEYSRTVFVECKLGSVVAADGWMPWSGDFALKTLYYGEFMSSGLGASLTGRVSWSNQIPVDHVSTYSVNNFIQGNEWIQTSS